ncbi:2-amino-4-hydroxy-6-hydroxymethyldihydropteridinediphosphokinase [Selenomonas sp. GACV-9]|uniref:2-amino-4-hydroxy-6- hydroxymethyldihydropteridine diphosphokinase n=1 Tax=Selenomonas sp. GACV-9 TaxID=3158782 RepID=UPI0008E6DF3B|nr:2-amino-4-hydroxy-6-hydroxymethyldihydropteridinediphosphokinase [Selenomonas ruminantium]
MSREKRTVWLSLGANLGNRGETIREALRQIDAVLATRLVQVASFYETAPWGKLDQPGFINTAAEIETGLTLTELLHAMQRIELALGRVRHEHWGARTIDIDLLAAAGVVSDTEELQLPHPYLTERAFVLRPLMDIAPELVIKGRAIRDWYEQPAIRQQAISQAAEVSSPWPIRMIAACDKKGGIGRGGQLLARVPEDMARFKALTMGHIVIMGRRTQQSLPGGAPLGGRTNIVLTRSEAEIPGFIICHSLIELWQVIGKLAATNPARQFWCIGGGEVYRQLLPYAEAIELTQLRAEYPADTFFPDTNSQFVRQAAEPGPQASPVAKFISLRRRHGGPEQE